MRPIDSTYIAVFALIGSLGMFGFSIEGRSTQVEGALPLSVLDTPASVGSRQPHLTKTTSGDVLLSWVKILDKQHQSLRYSVFKGRRWNSPQTVIENVPITAYAAPIVLDAGHGRLGAVWLTDIPESNEAQTILELAFTTILTPKLFPAPRSIIVILFAHEIFAFRVRDLLWRARRKTDTVATLQLGHQCKLGNAAIRKKARAMDAEISCAESIDY